MRPPRGLRVRAVLDEGQANVASAPLRSLVLAVAVGVIAFLVVAFTVTDVSGIASRYRQQVRSGRFMFVARSAEPTGLDVARCEALNTVPGIRSAGAVLGSRSVFPVAAPSRPYEELRVTPGLIGAWFPGSTAGSARPGELVGRDAASELGLTSGSSVVVAAVAQTAGASSEASPLTRVVPVDRVLPASPRQDDADRNLFEVQPPVGHAPSCFVDAEPSAFESVDQMLIAWFPDSEHVNVTSFLEDQAMGRSPESELAARSSAVGWMAGAAVVTALVMFLWYGRREEFALYRLLGVSRSTLAGLLGVEALLTVALPVLIGVGIAVVLLQSQLDTFLQSDVAVTGVGHLVTLDLASFALALVPIPLLGLLVVARRSPFDLLKGF